MTISIILLLLAILAFYSTSIQSRKLLFFTLFFLSFIFLITYSVADYLGGNGIDNSVIYHLSYGLKGAGFLDLWKVILTTVVGIVAAISLSYYLVFKRKVTKAYQPKVLLLSFIFLIFSLIYNPTYISILDILGLNSANLNIEEATRDFNNYYSEPSIENNGSNKNLVFIYSEGVEQTHMDEELFPGLTPNLSRLQSESLYFDNIRSTIGTRFTIGGIVASHCGIPLLASSHLNSMGNADRFLPHATCLGDLLSDEGYYLSYFGGADLEFAGKGKFLSGHGFDEVSGLHELQEKMSDKEYASWWGLYDDTLFSFVSDRFRELSQKDQNFALFALTLDAHHPWGNPSKSCDGLVYQDGESEILNAVHCSDKLISELVENILSQPGAEDTIVVVGSDHLALQNSATEILDSSESGRSNLLMIFNSDRSPERIEALGATLDTGNTLLPFLGFEGEIGLGRNLLSEEYSEGVTKYIQKSLVKWRAVYARFWDFPQIENRIEISIVSDDLDGENIVSIDNRDFGIPIMIEFNKKLETDILFKHRQADLINVDEEYSVFKNRIKDKESDDRAYLIVDLCSEISNIDLSISGDGICYLVGKKKQFFEGDMLIGDKILTSGDLLQFVGK
jgi:phosphoglycerol transferase